MKFFHVTFLYIVFFLLLALGCSRRFQKINGATKHPEMKFYTVVLPMDVIEKAKKNQIDYIVFEYDNPLLAGNKFFLRYTMFKDSALYGEAYKKLETLEGGGVTKLPNDYLGHLVLKSSDLIKLSNQQYFMVPKKVAALDGIYVRYVITDNINKLEGEIFLDPSPPY